MSTMIGYHLDNEPFYTMNMAYHKSHRFYTLTIIRSPLTIIWPFYALAILYNDQI